MRDQHEHPGHREEAARSHDIVYAVRVQDPAMARRPMRSLVAVGGVLVAVVAIGAWFRWNAAPPPSAPAWAGATIPPTPAAAAPTPVPTPVAAPSLAPLALGEPRQLLILSERGLMATSERMAFVAGFPVEQGAAPHPSARCGEPYLWPIASVEDVSATMMALGSVEALGATPSGPLVALGRGLDCSAPSLAFGDLTLEASSSSSTWQILPDLTLPWQPAAPAWLGVPPDSAAGNNGPHEVVAYVAGTGTRTGATYRTADDGRGWDRIDGWRPLGWDPSGRPWFVTTDGDGAPGDGPPPPGMTTGIGGEGSRREPGIIFRDLAMLNVGRSVWTQPLGGGGGIQEAIALADSRFAANARVLAIVGGGGSTLRPTVAVSLDGSHFVRRLLPPEVAVDPASILAVAIASDAVLVETTVAGGTGAIVWEVPLTGVPPAQDPPPNAAGAPVR